MSKLLGLMPYRLHSPPVVDFEGAMETAVQAMEDAYWEMTGELYGSTAAAWLPLWEKAYGIPAPDGASLEARRAKIQSKMRGTGTASLDMIWRVASSFAQNPDNCTVREYPADYRFAVNYADELPDMKSIRAAIGEIQPAHLELLLYFLPRPIPFENSEKLYFQNLKQHFRFFNGSQDALLLNGGALLDGSWHLNQAFRGLNFYQFKMGTAVRQRYSLSASVITDTMYRLDGSVTLDGSKKLNAAIIKETI